MKMKFLSIELTEVFSHWLKDPSEINCRISLKNIVEVVKYQEQVLMEIQAPVPSDQVHILIQSDNIVLGSLTVSLESMFGPDLTKDLDNWINVEVPSESISLVTKQQVKDAEAKSLRLRLTGSFSHQSHAEVHSSPTKEQSVYSSPEESKNLSETNVCSPYDPEYGGLKTDQLENKTNTLTPVSDSTLKSPSGTPGFDLKSTENKSHEESLLVTKSPSQHESYMKSPQSKSPKAGDFDSVTSKTFEQEFKSPESKTSINFIQYESVPITETYDPAPLSLDEGYPQTPAEVSKSHNETVSYKDSSFSQSESFIKEPEPIKTSQIIQYYPKAQEDFQDKENESVLEQKIKSIDDSYSLGSSALQSENDEQEEEKEEIKEEPTRQRPKKINITASSVGSPCGYLNNIVRTEWHLKSIMAVLAKLKEELGNAFLKLIEESAKRDSRSPTSSPSRKLTNSGLRTPLVSQKSLNSSILSSFRIEEENILEIPGNVDVYLDRVSMKNLDILVSCVLGLLAKLGCISIQIKEIEPTKDIITMQEKAKNMINDSMKATQSEFDQESDNYDVMIKRLKDEIAAISYNLESTKKKNELLLHEKLSCDKTLASIKLEKEEILKKYHVNVDLDSIKQLKKANETLEKGRIEIEEKLSSFATQYKNTFESLAGAQSKYIEEKTSLLNEVKGMTSFVDQIERENHRIKSEMQGLSGFIYVDDELNKTLLNYQGNSRFHTQSLDSMRTQLTYLRSNKEDLASEAIVLHQKIDTETKKVKNSQTSWNKEIESNSEIITELAKEYKKLRQEVAYIEEVYSKKNNIDHNFMLVHSKSTHNQETKDQLIGELSYFSDFVFSLSQTFLQQKRIYGKVKAIVDEKEIEVEAMRNTVSEIKSNNPVYFPVPDDLIDQAIADYFNSRDDVLIVPFVRESHGVYLYGSKRVMVNVERGKLIVKVGGGFLPIEVFIDNYTDVELDKYGNKPLEASPKMKKFMAKWVGGLNPKKDSPEKIKESLVKAMEGHKFTSAYGIKELRPVIKKTEPFVESIRPETPIIEEDI